MGFFDYLLFGALINSLRNSGRSNNTHSSFSNDSYDRGYHDGYDDACLDHEDYCRHDDYDSGYDSCDCDCDFDSDCGFDF